MYDVGTGHLLTYPSVANSQYNMDPLCGTIQIGMTGGAVELTRRK